MREFYRNYNIIHFPMGNTGAQMGGWYRKEIKSVKDVKGLKMRIGGFSGRVLERMGGVPQNIPGGEIYQALEKGTIDAAEWVGPYDDLKLGFFKVAPFYHYPGWWEGGPQLDLYINTKAWDGLSSEYKAIVEAASAVAHNEMQAKYDARNPAALTQLLANKTKLVQMPVDVLDLAFKESMALYSELSAKNPNWKKVYTDYSAFRKESKPLVPLHRGDLRPVHAEQDHAALSLRNQALRQGPACGVLLFSGSAGLGGRRLRH